jgi:hypothetical protein
MRKVRKRNAAAVRLETSGPSFPRMREVVVTNGSNDGFDGAKKNAPGQARF